MQECRSVYYPILDEADEIGALEYDWQEKYYTELKIHFKNFESLRENVRISQSDTSKKVDLTDDEVIFYTNLLQNLYSSAVDFLNAPDNLNDENLNLTQHYSYRIAEPQELLVNIFLSITADHYTLTERVNYPNATETTQKE